MRWMAVFAILALWPLPSLAQTPCGEDAPCQVEGPVEGPAEDTAGDPTSGGEYYLSFPAGWDGQTPLPVLVFFHGHNSSGVSVINSGGIRSAFGDHGYLVVAPNGATMPGRTTRAWPARDTGGQGRDDVAFTLAVVDDVIAHYPVDESRILVGGFSAGGSMAWLMGCKVGNRFAGYVSVAGALRRPVPADACAGGPFRMMHIHGFNDGQVPLEGRGIRDWHQGDVGASLALLRATNQCRSNPHAIDMGDRYWCRVWNECESGLDIEFCLHPGGHGLPAGWGDLARAWFEAAGEAS